MTMQWLLERFLECPERIAFIHADRQVTYREVVDRTLEFQQALNGAGVKLGSVVAVVGDYSPDVFCMFLALAQNRCVIIPITRNAVVEKNETLGISGCDWCAEFDDDGINMTLSETCIPVENPLLLDFQKLEEPGLVLFSSGSTGRPKGILHNFDRVCGKFRKRRSALVAIPFLLIDHFGGINTILAIVSSLGTVVTVKDRSVAAICSAIERYRVELLPTTPSFLTILLASAAHRHHDLTSLKRITYGTETMPQTTLVRIGRAFPDIELQQTYGLSEVGVLHSQSRGDGSLWVRIGGEGFRTKVVDGILWVKSDYAMVGYLNAPSEFDADGWFNTQDRVEVDGDYFRILGRDTEIINIGGQKVYPAEVEDVILNLDNISDVAVFGEESKLLGQIVTAKVILKSPENVADLKHRIRSACLAKLSSFKAPTKIIISDESLYSVRQKKLRRARSD